MAPIRVIVSAPNRTRNFDSEIRVVAITYAAAIAIARREAEDPPVETSEEKIPTVRATHWPTTTVRWTRDSHGAGVANMIVGYRRAW
jgi:hypothetical protein